MLTDTASLVANSVCVNSCIPNGLQLAVLIKQFADLAGQPTDAAGIRSLINNSACINSCIPAGLQMAVLINLLSEIAGLSPSPVPSLVNLIPAGATYTNDFIDYDISSILLPNTTYQITFGVNDSSLFNNGGTPLQPAAPGTFQFTTGPALAGVFLLGTGGSNGMPVTAVIYAV